METSHGFVAQVPGEAHSWAMWGVPMTRQTSAAALLIFASVFLASCSGAPGGGCVSNCGGGNATLSFVLTATPPNPSTQLSIQTFTTTIAGITLTPATCPAGHVSLNYPAHIAQFN